MAFTETLSEFFNTDEFAQTVTVKTTQLNAIFDHEYREDLEIEGESPVLLCKTADLPTPLAQGDSVTIATKQYRVVGIEPDGTGVTLLVLEYVSG